MGKVTSYPTATSPVTGDVLYVVRSNTDYEMTVDSLFNGVSVPVKLANLLFLSGTTQSINNAGLIDAAHTITVLTNDSDAALTIANGTTDGQVKIILFSGGTHISTISGANLYSSIALNTVGQTAHLVWLASYWWKIN